MFEEIRNKYLYNKTQIVQLDKNGIVVDSDNLLFQLEKNTSIADFHPFFETIIQLIYENDEEFNFNCIHIETTTSKRIIDVIFNLGADEKSPFLIFLDFTDHYNNFQSIAQEKNESVLSFHLSELKNQQLQLEKTFKDKFLANISHDLKTPIWGLRFFLNHLGKTNLDEKQTESIQILKETNDHIFQLVEDLVDLSKIENGIMEILEEKFDLKESLSSLVAIIESKTKEKKLKFISEIQPNFELFLGDKVRINQILINLLDNAIKFTKKGSITLKVHQVSDDKTHTSILFSVSDTGPGILAAHKLDVFKSFKKLHDSKKVEGLGVGLSIVSKLVSLMNGTIDYTTEINIGTTFEVILPLQKA